MSQELARASEWLYHGIWQVLVRWFRVPALPPVLPALSGETIQTFRPANGFLRYLKFQFWLSVTLLDMVVLFVWFVFMAALPVVGLLITPLAAAIIVVPAVAAYVAIYLRFDTTWYVVSDRSMRIRRGIWVIRETTITFENIQNVTVNQGPLQRFFGIADVLVQTAGGGGSASHGQDSAAMLGGHNGLIEGIENAPQIRDLIMSRLKRSMSAGLGDEAHEPLSRHGVRFSDQHIAVLREIRDLSRELVASH